MSTLSPFLLWGARSLFITSSMRWKAREHELSRRGKINGVDDRDDRANHFKQRLLECASRMWRAPQLDSGTPVLQHVPIDFWHSHPECLTNNHGVNEYH